MDDTIKKDSKFRKGKSGNAKGRPPKQKVSALIYKKIIQEADGNPTEVLKLMLKNAFDLGLDVKTTYNIAKELAPFEKAKLSSVKIDEDKTTTFIIQDATKTNPLIQVVEHEEDKTNE